MPRHKKGEDTIQILFEKYRSGSIEARDKIIEYYMPRAEQIAEEFFDLGLEKEDVIAAAYEGLVIAVTRYKDLKCKNISRYMEFVITTTIRKNILTSYTETLGNKYNKSLIIYLQGKTKLNNL